MSDHSATISISVTLAAAPNAPVGFGIPTLFVDEAAGNPLGPVGTVRYLEYSAAGAQLDADVAAGYITAATKAAVVAAFAQPRKLSSFRICRVDTAGTSGPAEVEADALTALEGEGVPIWLVLTDSRTASAQVAFSTAIESSAYFLILQSSDGDWLTSGWPAAYSAIEDRERTAVIFHDDNGQWSDVAWGANRAAFDPDNAAQGSVQWECNLSGVNAYTTRLTATQINAAKAHPVALVGELGGATRFVDPGHNCNNRAIYERLTADWFALRAREAVEGLVVQQALRGRKIILDPSGQAAVLAVLRGVAAIGESARHFVTGQVLLETPTLTSADLDARRITVTGSAQIAGSGRIFVVDLYFSRDQVVIPEVA